MLMESPSPSALLSSSQQRELFTEDAPPLQRERDPASEPSTLPESSSELPVEPERPVEPELSVELPVEPAQGALSGG